MLFSIALASGDVETEDWLQRREKLNGMRRRSQGISGRVDFLHLPRAAQFSFAMDGETHVLGWPGKFVSAPAAESGSTPISQVGGGAKIHRLLRFNGSRPVWSRQLISAMQRVAAARGGTLSPPAYPHSAEDILLACRQFAAGAAT